MELLSSSSDDEGDAPVRLSTTRSAGADSSSSGGNGILTGSLGATDRSDSEVDLIASLLSTSSPAAASWRGSSGDSRATTGTYAQSSSSSRYDGASVATPEHAKKPVVSAREMLLKLCPASTQSTSKLVSPPATKPSSTSFRTPSSLGSTIGDGAGSSRQSSFSATPPRRALGSEPDSTLSASERIAMKYGLLRTQSPGASADLTAGSRQRKLEGERKKTYQALREGTPVRASPAAEPRKTPERSPFWNVEPAKAPEKTAATTNYVSPFASKDGFVDMKRRRRLSGEDGVRYHDLPAAAVYDDSKRAGTEIGNRPRHVVASSITAVKDGGVDLGDEWMSDAKDVALEQRERAKARASAASEALKVGVKAALPLERVQPRSLKRTRRSRSGSSDDECDTDDADRWPRLPFPETMQDPLTLTSSEEDARSATVCANINSFLFDYQREGAQFLYSAYLKNTGAILGDEMGLGKTIQVIAFIAAILGKCGDRRDREVWRELRSKRREAVAGISAEEQVSVFDLVAGPRPLLIVVPASLLHNWEAELQTWLCCCTALLFGKPSERSTIVKQIPRGEYEIVICSYEILKMTIDRLNAIPWEAIIFDEMHCLKNPESQLTRAVQSMTCARKLGLTGTLMQNNEKELHCLVDTIAPGVLGTWSEFRTYYGDDIKYGRKKSAVTAAVEMSRRKEKKLRHVLTPHYLRRDKEINPRFQEIKKCDQVVFCDLTPYQLAAYERILAMPEFELLRRGDDVCDCERKSKRKRKQCCYQVPSDISKARPLIWERFHDNGEACRNCPNCVGLVCVAQLLKLSNHMELLKVNPRDSPEMQVYGANFAVKAFGEDIDDVGGVEQVASFQKLRAIGTKTCGKMQVLEKLLAIWKRRKQKTLLFSRSTRMLDILQQFLISKATTYSRLDGNTKIDDRLRLVNDFNSPDSNASVFLISTRAGGLGLNLPSATNVVIFDPSWNPAHDCQAQDRAYRIGQTKDVQVYRLITLGTIEEMIYVRQIYKQQLSDTTLKGAKAPRYFEGVQGDPHQQGELFGIRNLLCWKEGGVLKGIQDAYRRSNDGLLIRENEIDYTRAVQPSASSKQKKGSKRQEEEEMVEIADEIVSSIVVAEGDEETKAEPAIAAVSGPVDSESDAGEDLLGDATTFMHETIVGDNQADALSESVGDYFSEPEEVTAARDLADSKSDCDTADCFPGGGKRFMHEEIVGDNRADALSEFDADENFVEFEQKARSEKKKGRAKSAKSSAPVQKKLGFGNALRLVSPKPASIARTPPKSKSEAKAVGVPTPPERQPQPRKSLYIPKYL